MTNSPATHMREDVDPFAVSLRLENTACYIPARGQSSGLPNKNLASLGGVPLFEHTLRAAQSYARNLAPILLSTDDEEIHRRGARAGVEVLGRPAALRSQTVTVAQVLAHDLPVLRERIGDDGHVIILLPTSPFRTADDIQAAVAYLRERPWAHTLVGVSAFPARVHQALDIDGDGRLSYPFEFENLTARSQRQHHKKYYFPNGSIFIVRLDYFASHERFYDPHRSVGFVTRPLCGVDVDDEESLELARLILREGPR